MEEFTAILSSGMVHLFYENTALLVTSELSIIKNILTIRVSSQFVFIIYWFIE